MLKRMFIVFMLMILLLSGCATTGIHLYTVQFIGDIRENSILHQPIKGVQIFTASGKRMGETDAEGKFSIKVTVHEGKTELIFQHPDYCEKTLVQTIDGGYQSIVQLPPLYLTLAGGQIRGQISRVLPESVNNAEEVVFESKSLKVANPDIVKGEYNLVTQKGKEWLLEKLDGEGQIVAEPGDGLYTIYFESTEKENRFLQKLDMKEDVEYIEPNSYVYLQELVVEDAMFSDLWNMQMLGGPTVWQHATGRGVKVAVLDSLYSSEHPDLMANLYFSMDAYGNIQNDLWLGRHGMHVAGIIGAVADQKGVIGLAPEVSIIPIRVFQWGESGQPSAAVDAIVRGINLAIEEGVQVINMSFGMGNYNQVLHDAVKKAYNAGIVLVAASGNNGSGQMLFPAALPEVIGVGAVGPDEKRTYYSQYGLGIELMAPGGNIRLYREGQILSTVWDSYKHYTWGYEQGTSMAAPHVSGLAALLISYGITDPDYIRLILRETAKDLGTPGYDEENGYGLIDPARVLALFQKSYVFFGTVESGYAQLRSQVIQTEVNGEYLLTGVHSGDGRVIGWIDINDNLIIDAGDYLGQSELMQNVQEGDLLSNIDVTLTRVEGNFTAVDIGARL